MGADTVAALAVRAARLDYLAGLTARGVCTHATAVTTSECGHVHHPEQVGLEPDQVACTEHTGGCAAVFADFAAWQAARTAL